ncbi:MAG: hypothetical protein RIE60_03430 [Roseovarius sp.]
MKRPGKRLPIRRRRPSPAANASVKHGPTRQAEGWLGWFDRRSGLWGAAQFVALVVAGAWGVFLLVQSATERKIDNALQYATQLSEGRTGEARHLLDRLWYSQPENVRKFRGQLALLPPDMRNASGKERGKPDPVRAFVHQWILPGNEEIGPVDVQLAIADIADMLDQVALCATECEGLLCWRGAQCHEETTRDLFCGYTRSFHRLYGGELDNIRATYGNVGLGLASAAFQEDPQCKR